MNELMTAPTIRKQSSELTVFDEALTRCWVKRIVIYGDKYTIEFKSGISMNIHHSRQSDIILRKSDEHIPSLFFYARKELKPPDSNSTVSEPFLGWVFGTAIAKKQFSTLDLRKNACFSYCKYVSANSFSKKYNIKFIV